MKPSLDLEDEVFLFYDDVRNVFYDEDGYIVTSIFSYISPNMLLLFRLYKEAMYVRNNQGQKVVLIWPEHDEN